MVLVRLWQALPFVVASPVALVPTMEWRMKTTMLSQQGHP